MEESAIVERQFLKSCGDRTALLEPANGAFDHGAGTIGRWVIADRTASPRRQAWRNYRANPMLLKPMADMTGIITAITRVPLIAIMEVLWVRNVQLGEYGAV